MPSPVNKFLSEAAPHLADVVRLALWTMQRKGDVLGLTTIAYSDDLLWITQGKTGARVRIKPADEIMPLLRKAKNGNRKRILVNSYGDIWTSSGFDTSFPERNETPRNIWCDLSRSSRHNNHLCACSWNGMDIERIAEISGHSKSEC